MEKDRFGVGLQSLVPSVCKKAMMGRAESSLVLAVEQELTLHSLGRAPDPDLLIK